MARPDLGPEDTTLLEQVLGYLNFSSGAEDPQFLANLNELFRPWHEAGEKAIWPRVHRRMVEHLDRLQAESKTFRDSVQGRAVLGLVSDHVLPGYRAFHRELLFHLPEEELFNSFFVGRVCEAVLRQGPPWEDSQRITDGAVRDLNDYIGHRPVAALRGRKMEPYAHEWVRPVPVYIRGAGAVVGAAEQVVIKAVELLEDTDDDLLRSAHFDPARMREIAVDPRAYDFDHPVNKRPNYHFGQWDPHLIDGQGFYRRFVVQQVSMDALMSRLDDCGDLDRSELVFEAAAVLAGTILMASGISGAGPESHDSTVTLANLLPTIARYRDAFYERMFGRLSGTHAQRLLDEAGELRQPFGGARQYLNAQLARRRATQLEHAHLARIFAGMGYPETAGKEADVVATTSARFACRIDCLLLAGHRDLDSGEYSAAAERIDELFRLVHVGIECGAIVDPWNILGFDAQYSLFPALENSIRDHRVDDLLELMEQIFAYCSRVWGVAAAADDTATCRRVSRQFKEFAEWWRQFAAHEVSSVDAIDSMDAYQAALHVAEALNLWHKAGAAAGDIRFWKPHAKMFDSPRAYALVVQALLDQGDFVASMALLIHWLSQAERIGLERGDSSFYQLVERWNRQRLAAPGATPEQTRDVWRQIRRFFDQVESNAGEFWHPPRFDLNELEDVSGTVVAEDPADDEETNEYWTAYEDVVYNDSTDDGFEGEIFDNDDETHDELVERSKAVAERLAFLYCLARLWKTTAIHFRLAELPAGDSDEESKLGDWESALQRWGGLASDIEAGLDKLVQQVSRYRIAAPTGDHDSMVEYDRRRTVKESLLERVIATGIEMSSARTMLMAAVCPGQPEAREAWEASLPAKERSLIVVLSGILGDDQRLVKSRWNELLQDFGDKPLLYVPLAKGGDPRAIVETRARQQTIQDLLVWLPRRGLIEETCGLIDLARLMERGNPVGPGAVTEFDELFKLGYKAIVESLVESSLDWNGEGSRNHSTRKKKKPTGGAQACLVSCLEQVTEALLLSWLSHSRTLRLSVLERAQDEETWDELVAFVQAYGGELFTQRFLNLGNLRAILHQGTRQWICRLRDSNQDYDLRLLDDVADNDRLKQASDMLSLVLEAVVENYGEYRDYNSTTTQSDQGNMLYTLLDFLRLRTRYDRVCWNLKPVIWAHEILVRLGVEQAAKTWRRALAQRINTEAEQYLQELAQLQKKYAMRMPTVADRLAERFVRPMAIDRIRALVEPAIREAKDGKAKRRSFEVLYEETALLTREPTGVGLDVPAWLVALEEQVDRSCQPAYQRNDVEYFKSLIPSLRLTREETSEQLTRWCERKKKKKK